MITIVIVKIVFTTNCASLGTRILGNLLLNYSMQKGRKHAQNVYSRDSTAFSCTFAACNNNKDIPKATTKDTVILKALSR